MDPSWSIWPQLKKIFKIDQKFLKQILPSYFVGLYYMWPFPPLSSFMSEFDVEHFLHWYPTLKINSEGRFRPIVISTKTTQNYILYIIEMQDI